MNAAKFLLLGGLWFAQVAARVVAKRLRLYWGAPVRVHAGPWCFAPRRGNPRQTDLYRLVTVNGRHDEVRCEAVQDVERWGESAVLAREWDPSGPGGTWLLRADEEFGGRERDAMVARHRREVYG